MRPLKGFQLNVNINLSIIHKGKIVIKNIIELRPFDCGLRSAIIHTSNAQCLSGKNSVKN